ASGNPSVATVSPSGQVTGVAPGTAPITATSEGKSGTATLTVTSVPVASVSLSPATANIRVGQTMQLTATPKDSAGNTLTGRTVTWASSNTSVASVSGSGLVTSVVAGTATLTATSEGKDGSAVVTVTLVPVASVAVAPATASVRVGQTVQLTATPKDSAGGTLAGRAVTWGNSNTSGATVPVASVTVSPATASIRVGQTVQLTATPKDSAGGTLAGRTVTWRSSDSTVAPVSPAGLVTGVAPGSASITGTSEGKSSTAAITVTPIPVVSVAVAPTTASLTVGQTAQ